MDSVTQSRISQRPSRIARGCVVGLIGSCVLLVVLDFFVPKEHPHFSFEQQPLFFALYGFLSCAVLVLVAKYLLRPLVMRGEEYYD